MTWPLGCFASLAMTDSELASFFLGVALVCRRHGLRDYGDTPSNTCFSTNYGARFNAELGCGSTMGRTEKGQVTAIVSRRKLRKSVAATKSRGFAAGDAAFFVEDGGGKLGEGVAHGNPSDS